MCLANQNLGVLYATTLYSNDSKAVLEAALCALLKSFENEESKLLYSLYYEQEQQASTADAKTASDASLDLAFNDDILHAVEEQWKAIIADENSVIKTPFMQFEDREGINDEEDADEGY